MPASSQRVVQAHNHPRCRRTAQRNVEIVLGALGHGFELPLDGVALVSEQEIFGEKAARSAPQEGRSGLRRRRLQAPAAGRLRRPQAARRRHLQGADQAAAALGRQEVAVDFLHLEYDGGALYLPVWRLNEVQAYAGAEGIKPKLDQLGGETWKKTRAKISQGGPAARRGAAAALRRSGRRCPATSFALDAGDGDDVPRVRGDLPVRGDARPAEGDRRRARATSTSSGRWTAWSAATSASARPRSRCARRSRSVLGRQAGRGAGADDRAREQHSANFAARFAGYRSTCASLSRFKTRKEQQEMLKQLGEGKVDVVIGTHRLLSNDVHFKDLGLARRRRGAALRRHAQGAAQAAAHAGRRADADRDADPAHAAHGAHRAARSVDHHHAAGRPPRHPHHRRALRRRLRRRRRQARAGARRAGLLRVQPRRGHLRVGAQAARALARACASPSATGRWRARSSRR